MSTIKLLVPLIFGPLVNMILVTLVLANILMIIGCCKKNPKFRAMNFSHITHIIYQSIINILQECNLKRDLENIFF
jgi:hypothetical protein